MRRGRHQVTVCWAMPLQDGSPESEDLFRQQSEMFSELGELRERYADLWVTIE